jgi:glyoxylase-like metal-dependent hydrolase (beta-lactamase superfamily II)
MKPFCTLRSNLRNAFLFSLISLALSSSALQAEGAASETVHLRGGVFRLTGTMANSTALSGADGTLLVDSGQNETEAKAMLAAIQTAGLGPVDYLVNTHRHYDHVAGNAVFGSGGAAIIATPSVRESLATNPILPNVPLLPSVALPSICFDKELTLFFDGEVVSLYHPQGPAHTEGDLVVYFRHADVLATGDILFWGMYPYIDPAGSAPGMATALREVAAMIGEHTIVVPGHGPLTDRKGLLLAADMLEDVSQTVARLAAEGKTLPEIIAAHPSARWDEAFGKGFMSPDNFVQLVYNTLPANTGKAK